MLLHLGIIAMPERRLLSLVYAQHPSYVVYPYVCPQEYYLCALYLCVTAQRHTSGVVFRHRELELDTSKKINIGKLLHLLDIAALYHFLVVEKNPLPGSFPGQLLPNKRYVVSRMMLATWKCPSESINLPCMHGDTLMADDRL